MKSLVESLLEQSRLSESLFDDDLVEKDILFGDMLELQSVSFYGEWTDILDLFSESKLKKAAKGKIYKDANNYVDKYYNIPGYKEKLKYIISIILDLPWKPEVLNTSSPLAYHNEINSIFKDIISRGRLGKTVGFSFKYNELDDILTLTITCTKFNGPQFLWIKFKKK